MIRSPGTIYRIANWARYDTLDKFVEKALETIAAIMVPMLTNG